VRNLVEPPPSLHCDLCHGELRLKQLLPYGPSFELDVAIFVCAKCSHEQSHRLSHDPYVAHAASIKQPTKDRRVADVPEK
jgi:hypothetical protein